MWRGLVCLGLALSMTGLCQAQDRQTQREIRRDIRKGRIVRVNPETNTIIVRDATGKETREIEYKVAADTRFWGPDRNILRDGIKYRGFVPGTDVWYVPGTATGPVAEVWLTEPNGPMVNQAPTYVEGKIVRVDPVHNMVVVRSNLGTEVKEFEYRVDPNTKYWGADRREFNNGLTYQGFREGSPIWYRVGPGDRNRIINEVRFYDPVVKPEIRKR